MSPKASDKEAVRKRMRHRLTELPLAEKVAQSEKIRAKLSFRSGLTVASFAGTPNEPDLLPLLQRFPKVRWVFPKVSSEGLMTFREVKTTTDLTPGFLGIREPKASSHLTQIDLFLCPGLAFTREGHRLGQGGGFYDRFLTAYPDTPKIGIAFTCQILSKIPTRDHDLSVDGVITP